MFLGLWPWQRLNAVQSAVFESAFLSRRNLLVVAPTGTGKTVVAELAIVGAMQQRLTALSPALAAQMQQTHCPGAAPRAGMPDVSSMLPGKVLYLAPMAALCQEKAHDWRARFGPLGIRVEALAGDGLSPGGLGGGDAATSSLMAADVICSTPEKWDALSRRWRDNVGLTGGVSLVILDEVHHVGTSRGAALEAIVARMKTISESEQVKAKRMPATALRFVALAATLRNATDVARWLRVAPGDMHVFGEEFRPVPLEKHVLAYFDGKNEFLFSESLFRRLPGVVSRFSDGRPTLIFCTSRKAAQVAAQVMADAATRLIPAAPTENPATAIRAAGRAGSSRPALLEDPSIGRGPSPFVADDRQRAQLESAAAASRSELLSTVLRHGVAFHHGGLEAADRSEVESLFKSRTLRVLATTTTLALGVNLPAHLVVVLSTSAYRGAAEGYTDLDPSDVIQMIGRAGRPGLDSRGVGVVMTARSKKDKYEAALFGPTTIVESGLLSSLGEHINAEVACRSIACVSDAYRWAASTFLAVRAERDPRRYEAELNDAAAGWALPCAPAQPPELNQGPEAPARRALKRLCRQVLAKLVATGVTRALPQSAAARGVTAASAAGQASEPPRPSPAGLAAAAAGGEPRTEIEAPGGARLDSEIAAVEWRSLAKAVAGGEDLLLQPRSVSRGIAHAYLSVASALRLLVVPYSASFRLILERVVACVEVLDGMPIRRDDKKRLNELNALRAGCVRYRTPGKVQTPQAKALVLLQAAMARAAFGDARLEQDARMLAARAERLLVAVSNIAASEDVRSPLAVNCRILGRSLAARSWGMPPPESRGASSGGGEAPTSQIHQLSAVLRCGVTDAMAAAWVSNGVITLENFCSASLDALASMAARSRGSRAAAASAQAVLRGVLQLTVRASKAGPDAVDLDLEPAVGGATPVGGSDPASGDGATPAPAAARSHDLSEYELFVCRNAPGGLVERKPVRALAVRQSIRVRLRQPQQPTMVQLADAAGAAGVVAEAPGNADLVFVHLLHRRLVGLDCSD
ncbi:hypothetical protein FNF29_06861 [Cafeteria roenbergensis]|uniref:Helicase ATP-binding domain-containing protein n=1 Tax=Cafeteria roenbergensis TaxID=33653 RepID=A0A5A8C572_CAFRO|nr:hypothetical protein FNF29_06861 [Cafeteria roenbergensis]|eukprot:KAA0148202.1 hypothetical protein FNF29_06861 [Cafeteria roenbergensis]